MSLEPACQNNAMLGHGKKAGEVEDRTQETVLGPHPHRHPLSRDAGRVLWLNTTCQPGRDQKEWTWNEDRLLPKVILLLMGSLGERHVKQKHFWNRDKARECVNGPKINTNWRLYLQYSLSVNPHCFEGRNYVWVSQHV